MDRTSLSKLSKDKLIDIILQQQSNRILNVLFIYNVFPNVLVFCFADEGDSALQKTSERLEDSQQKSEKAHKEDQKKQKKQFDMSLYRQVS